MSEPLIEITMDETSIACEDCGEVFEGKSAKQKLGQHRRKEHGIESPRAQERRKYRGQQETRRQTSASKLQKQLEQGAGALVLLPFMAQGTQDRLLDTRVSKSLEECTHGFASSWAAVAEQNDWVRDNLARLLTGGVYVNAAVQTLALGYTVAFLSGMVQLHPGALMLLPDLRQYLSAVQPMPPSAAPPAGGNGNAATAETA